MFCPNFVAVTKFFQNTCHFFRIRFVDESSELRKVLDSHRVIPVVDQRRPFNQVLHPLEVVAGNVVRRDVAKPGNAFRMKVRHFLFNQFCDGPAVTNDLNVGAVFNEQPRNLHQAGFDGQVQRSLSALLVLDINLSKK